MITVLEAIKLSTEYLHKKGIESPRVNAELLLAFALNFKRLELYLQFDRPLKENEINKYRELIKRRGTFEPLQYIAGKVEFYGLDFTVSPAVLIPRPETEILVETILKKCNVEKNISILEVGCGSGCIGISLAENLPNAKIYCTDISVAAIQIAKKNAEANKAGSKINFIKHDILSQPLNFINELDIIVSNPPYIAKNDFQSLQREIKDFEPRYALTDESDGYIFFKSICSKSEGKLKKNGLLFFEIGEGQSDTVKKIMSENNFDDIQLIGDYQNINRVIFGVKK